MIQGGKLPVMLIDTSDIVGASDIARMFGVKPQTVRAWMLRPEFPPPIAKPSGGAIWDVNEVEKWVDAFRRDHPGAIKGVGPTGVAPAMRRYTTRRIVTPAGLRWGVWDRHQRSEIVARRSARRTDAVKAAQQLELEFRAAEKV